jgi:hypothetical protein
MIRGGVRRDQVEQAAIRLVLFFGATSSIGSPLFARFLAESWMSKGDQEGHEGRHKADVH